MKPPQEIAENDKPFDGVCLEYFPETYNVLFITKCFRLAPHISIIYINKTLSAMRICETCYLTKLSDHEKQRYQHRNAWHSIGHIQPFNTVCFFCDKRLLSICCTAFRCNQCLEKFLDNQSLIRNGIEIEI